MDVLTKAHVAKHGLTRLEYLRRHPEQNRGHMWGCAPGPTGQYPPPEDPHRLKEAGG